MSLFFTIIFLAFLIYVSYFKIVGLLFRGRQYNRFFATLISTVLPVIGSVPAFIMASKYERRVGGIATRMNDYVLRCSIIALQLISVFLLFCPLFESDSMTASLINMIFGLNMGDITIFKSAYFLLYIVIAPFVAAVINALDVKFNIRNVLSYVVALISCLTVFAIAVFADTDGEFEATFVLWLYCLAQVTIMLLSVFSLIKVRNRFLLCLEKEESQEEVVSSEAPAEPKNVTPASGTYKCAKCGSFVPKGTICPCREETKVTLDKLMAQQNEKETSDFCVYCKRALAPGEACNCVGEGFGITVKPEQFEGRKCRYCGQILVGDSTCVCEKIMKNSKPADEHAGSAEPRAYFEQSVHLETTHISDEMAELEKKIEAKFSEVKSSLAHYDE